MANTVHQSSTGSATLLPCPFCGPGQSMVDAWFDDVSKRWAISCGRCGSSSGRSIHAEGSKEAAIKSWNTRPAASHDALVKALQGFVTAYGSQDESSGGLDKADAAARAILSTLTQSAGEH